MNEEQKILLQINDLINFSEDQGLDLVTDGLKQVLIVFEMDMRLRAKAEII